MSTSSNFLKNSITNERYFSLYLPESAEPKTTGFLYDEDKKRKT